MQLSMGNAVVSFNVTLRDRSGSRLLFATTTPFVPRRIRLGVAPPQSPTLRLACQDLRIGLPPRPLEGRLDIPLQPSFAEEA